MPPTRPHHAGDSVDHTAHTLHLQGQLFPPVGRYRVYADAAIPRRYAPFGRNPALNSHPLQDWVSEASSTRRTSSEFCWIRRAIRVTVERLATERHQNRNSTVPGSRSSLPGVDISYPEGRDHFPARQDTPGFHAVGRNGTTCLASTTGRC